ncbi:MAG TPA: ABC transporter, partial [Rhodospirillaceae bacterium]|nr:ABC transporter [Rhodospirillaceae bacterium]
MKELFARLAARPLIAVELVAASFFANLLALASPLFVIQVLNRYVAYGVDATLATLTAGVVIAIVLEFAFRQLRLKLAAGVNAGKDVALSAAAFDVLIGAKAAALDRLPPGLQREVVSATDSIQTAYSPVNVAAVL